MIRGSGCIRSQFLWPLIPPCTISQQEADKKNDASMQKKPGSVKFKNGEKLILKMLMINKGCAINQLNQGDQCKKGRQWESKEIKKSWRDEAKLWVGAGRGRRGKPTVCQRQLNCSYLHHNVKGVLVRTGTQEANTQVTSFIFCYLFFSVQSGEVGGQEAGWEVAGSPIRTGLVCD